MPNNPIFERAVNHVLEAEGGYVNHSQDRGGATKYGITQSTLSEWRGQEVSDSDVQNLGAAEAKSIYYKKYWQPLRLDSVNQEVFAMIVFDQAVNKGVASTARAVQRTLGVIVDGVIGPQTIAAIQSRDARELGLAFIKDAQVEYAKIVKGNPRQVVFLEGWIRRTHKLLDFLYS